MQCEQGALYSYRKAENNLETFNSKSRPINNHTQIKRISGKVGEILSQKNAQELIQEELPNNIASELIIQVDGGHIPIQDKDKRSFEALSAIIYKPENLIRIDKNHGKITEKTCVVSAQADGLKTIKSYVINAAKKQGLAKTTLVIALADGAKNCWSVIFALQPYCQSIECILDWFHIAKKFQNTQEKLGESFQKSLDSIKWEIWHGHSLV